MLLLTLLGLALPLPATQDSDLERLIAGARHALVVKKDDWSGPGADFLERSAAESRFFLIGEQHGNRETPRLTRVLAEKIQPLGYRALAVETGPCTGAHLNELAGRGEGIEPFRALLDTYPFGVPFFWWRGEARLLVDVVPRGYEVWGLDQAFVGSARFLFDRLQELAPDDGAVETLATFQERAWSGFERYTNDESTAEMFLNTATEADFDRLDAAFAEAGADAHTILAEMRESAAVYQLFAAGETYASNHRRVRLMKRHLLERLTSFDFDGRVLMKFGNMHMGRGYSPLNQLDLGNQAAELALARGGDSFHLTVAGLSLRYDDGRVVDYRGEAPHLALFGSPEDEGWSVVDLRALRPHFHEDANRARNEALARLAFRFDAVLVVPQLTRAKMLVD